MVAHKKQITELKQRQETIENKLGVKLRDLFK